MPSVLAVRAGSQVLAQVLLASPRAQVEMAPAQVLLAHQLASCAVLRACLRWSTRRPARGIGDEHHEAPRGYLCWWWQAQQQVQLEQQQAQLPRLPRRTAPRQQDQ